MATVSPAAISCAASTVVPQGLPVANSMIADAMRAEAARVTEAKLAEQTAESAERLEVQADPDEVQAIANLKDVLHGDELKRFSYVFGPDGAKSRADTWKERNAKRPGV